MTGGDFFFATESVQVLQNEVISWLDLAAIYRLEEGLQRLAVVAVATAECRLAEIAERQGLVQGDAVSLAPSRRCFGLTTEGIALHLYRIRKPDIRECFWFH